MWFGGQLRNRLYRSLQVVTGDFTHHRQHKLIYPLQNLLWGKKSPQFWHALRMGTTLILGILLRGNMFNYSFYTPSTQLHSVGNFDYLLHDIF